MKGRHGAVCMLAAVGGALAFQAAPALTSVQPWRRRLTPALAGRGDPGHVALTFDDGPDPDSTPAFLDLLGTYRVRATFFLLGSMLQRAPWLGRELITAGHEVAVHGWEHRCLLARTPAATYADLTRARDLIAIHTGQPPRWYRPPYGVLTTAGVLAARTLAMRPVLWTAWGRDWERRATPDSVAVTVLRRVDGGGTVLLHDSDCTSAPGSWRTTLAALPEIIEEVRHRGLTIGPLAEHQRQVEQTIGQRVAA
jgi:peptidoglycan/xylan/chitin deacetylase (PgdA/CDA1 family)